MNKVHEGRDQSAREFPTEFDRSSDVSVHGEPDDLTENRSDFTDSVSEPIVSEIEVELSPEDICDQKQELRSEYGLKEYEADIIHQAIERLVREQAGESGKEWSDEVVSSVTNLVLAMMIQESDQRSPAF